MKKRKQPAAEVAKKPIGAACALLGLAGLGVFILYAALDTYYPNLIVLYGMTAYEPDPFERAFLFWFTGTAILATVGITMGLRLLLPGPVKPPSESGRTWAGAVALLALIPLLTAKFVVLHDSPTMDDENIYHFNAQLLLHGHLSLPTKIPPEFFAGRWGVNDRNNRLYPMYPFGWPALLAIGYIIHAPWIIGPLLALGVMLLAVRFAHNAYGLPVARIALLFFIVSPFFILTGATDLSPPAAAFGALMVLFGAERYLTTSKVRWLWMAGAGGGIAFQARQLNAVTLLTPFFLYLLYSSWKNKKFAHAGALLLPVLIAAGLYLAANYEMNGNPWLPGYVMEFRSRGVEGGGRLLGFGINYGLNVGGNGVHTVGQGIANSGFNLIRLSYWMLGWPLALPLVFASRFSIWTRLILVGLALELILYTGFYNPGLCLTGPTYLYDASAMLLVLAASGVRRLGEHFRIGPLLVAIVFVSLVMFVPLHVESLYHMTEGTSLLPRTIEERGIHHAVVFVNSVQAPWQAADLYKSFSYSPRTNASFDDDVVILKDLGPEKDRAALQTFFPDRQGFQYDVAPGWQVKWKPLP